MSILSDYLLDADLRSGDADLTDMQTAYDLADDGGTIQAADMLRLTNEPTRHITTSLRNALIMLGCVDLRK